MLKTTPIRLRQIYMPITANCQDINCISAFQTFHFYGMIFGRDKIAIKELIGKRIQALRKAHRLSQEQVADVGDF